MILTVTLNPAIDKTVTVDDFAVDTVNRIGQIIIDAAGKGINVSKVVKTLGGSTKTFTFLGGETGKYIENALKDERISFVGVPVEHPTRVNLKVVDHKNKTFTDINEPGGLVTIDQLQQLEKQLIDYATSMSYVVLTGSVPNGIPKDIYRKWIERLNHFGVKTVLDADGELFLEGVKGKPSVIKPNKDELEKYVGKSLTEEEMIQVSKSFIEDGVNLVAISLGEKGGLFITKDKVYKAGGLKVDVKSTVGAGDALVAGLCYGLQKGFPLEETIELAIATSAAQVTVEGTKVPSLEVVHQMKRLVKVEEI